MGKRHNPGCPCCAAACNDLCFVATACCQIADGAVIDVFATAAPGVILATGTVGPSGTLCLNLSAYAGVSLSYSASYRTADYEALAGILVGDWCGKTIRLDFAPALIGGGPTRRLCCGSCWPDTLPTPMSLSDPSGRLTATKDAYGSTSCTLSSLTRSLTPYSRPGLGCNARLSLIPAPVGLCFDRPTCLDNFLDEEYIPSSIDPTEYRSAAAYYLYCDETDDTIRLDVLCGGKCWVLCNDAPCGAPPSQTWRLRALSVVPASWKSITPTSLVCDPFSATFDVPAYSFTLAACSPCGESAGTFSWPARTITVTG
jgi:hypothetical protein